jgi:hypothetical protein
LRVTAAADGGDLDEHGLPIVRQIEIPTTTPKLRCYHYKKSRRWPA